MNKKFVYCTTKMRSKTVQRILDNMGKDPWWVKLKRWFVLELHIIKCLGIVKYFKKKVNMKYESLIPDRLGNDANRLLCAGLCLNCKHQSYKSDKNFTKTGICMVKFWKDKRCKLSPNKPVLKCADFEPCTK